jgi:hypothetical protein
MYTEILLDIYLLLLHTRRHQKGGVAMQFTVRRYTVPSRKPRNRYPLDQIKAIGDGFVIKKAFRPRGRLSAIGRHKGLRFSQATLPNGDLQLVCVKILRRGV